MNIRVWTGAVLLLATGTALSQRPLVYPLRSQSPSTQSVDNAYCYWQAKVQTHVDIARQPQNVPKTKRIEFAPDAGRGTTLPPLPPSENLNQDESKASNTLVSSTARTRSAAPMPPPGSPAMTHASSQVKLPPLPAPEPPMIAYWHAFGDCMQSRGYGVR
jgi:hypothetical protein